MSSLPRIIFFGTPEFAAIVAEKMRTTGYPILAVVTQPDQPIGRKQILSAPPVSAWAKTHKIPVYQPNRLDETLLDQLTKLQPEIFVVAAYGVIFPKLFLQALPLGAINVHASLLPRHRGASPISAAIATGDTETGVTIMQMDEGLDTGPMLATSSLPIAHDDTCGTLTTKLAHLGGELLSTSLATYARHELTPQIQNNSTATITKILKKSHGRIDWTASAFTIERHIRAMQPWPGAWTMTGNEMFKILRATVNTTSIPEAKPGQARVTTKGDLKIKTGEGWLLIHELQRAGKKPLHPIEILRGNPDLGTSCFA
jgi:methionyl-tRNA formyltransferase